MPYIDELKKLAQSPNRIFCTKDLSAIGISSYRIKKLIEDRVIERIKPGYYCLFAGLESASEAVQIAQLFPDGVLCMNTALFYYNYSDRTPLEWDIAIDKNASKSRFKLDYPYVRPYYLKSALLTFGICYADYEDCRMKIFDRDRLICECLFFEEKLDRETYNKAIQGYVADPLKNISHLLEYAQKRRIQKKVKDRVGVWL